MWELWRRTSKERGEWQLVLLLVWPPDKIRVTGVHETQQVPPSRPVTLLTAPIWPLTRLSPTNMSVLSVNIPTSGTSVHTNNISIKIKRLFVHPPSYRHFIFDLELSLVITSTLFACPSHVTALLPQDAVNPLGAFAADHLKAVAFYSSNRNGLEPNTCKNISDFERGLPICLFPAHVLQLKMGSAGLF